MLGSQNIPTDYYISRQLQFLKDIGEFGNTLIMIMSRNGANPKVVPWNQLTSSDFSIMCLNLQRIISHPWINLGSRDLQHLSMRLDLSWKHTLPPLETRDLSRWYKVTLYSSLAHRNLSQRQDSHSFYTQFLIWYIQFWRAQELSHRIYQRYKSITYIRCKFCTVIR